MRLLFWRLFFLFLNVVLRIALLSPPFFVVHTSRQLVGFEAPSVDGLIR